MNIRAANGNYVTAEQGGGIDPRKDPNLIALRANRTVAEPWEDFTLVHNSDDTVSFQTVSGYYITAEGGGGSFLRTDATQIGSWEKFQLINAGGGYALLASDNEHYICCEVGSCDPVLNATRMIIGPWEIFKSGQVPTERDRIIHVNGNLCNLRDSDDWPIFDPFIDWLIYNNLNKANDWIDRLRDNGTTHVNLDLSGDYDESLGWAPRYPIPGTDWTNQLDKFKRILDFIINADFIPHIHLAADGQGYDPVGMTYGWQWGMDKLPAILTSLEDYYFKCLWNAGYDGCFPNWSPDQFIKFYTMLRSVLGESSQLAAEFSGPGSIGYIHLGNGQADWDTSLQVLDVFCTELQQWPLSDTNGVQQVAARLLGDKSRNISPSNQGPYYLQAPRVRGECGICYYETLAYWAIRKYASEHDAVISADQGNYYGFMNFGNGLP